MLQSSKGFIIDAPFLDCLLIVGSFFIANLIRWVQGIRNFGLWQIDVVNFTYFYMRYAQL